MRGSEVRHPPAAERGVRSVPATPTKPLAVLVGLLPGWSAWQVPRNLLGFNAPLHGRALGWPAQPRWLLPQDFTAK